VSRWYETGAAPILHIAKSFSRRAAARRPGRTGPRPLGSARAHGANYGEEYVAAEIDRLEALLLENEQSPAGIVEEHLTKP